MGNKFGLREVIVGFPGKKKKKISRLTPEEIRDTSILIAVEHIGRVKEIMLKKEVVPDLLTIVYFTFKYQIIHD